MNEMKETTKARKKEKKIAGHFEHGYDECARQAKYTQVPTTKMVIS